jgi:ribosomal protein S8
MNKIFLFLNCLKTASLINQRFVLIKKSNIIENLAFLLYEEGLIQSYHTEIIKEDEFLFVLIRYYQNVSSFIGYKTFYKKKKNNYLKYKEILFLSEKRKKFFFSTKHGLLTSFGCKSLKTGGSLLFSC